MARAAVRAKQQAKAKAQPTKSARSHGRRGHAGGGNPNQQLFFVRLRRGQKWLYALLAVVFAVTFAGVGVGSGAGGLSDLYSGIFGGGGGGSVSKAQDEVKKNPAKGYRDLATAYESNGDNVKAVTALQSYVQVKKKDADAWAELGGLELSQAQTYAGQYQAAQQAAQLADPSTSFQPGGSLATAIGSNPAYQTAAQQATSQAQQLYQQATGAVDTAVIDYQHATKIRPHDPTLQEELASAAESAGNYPTAIHAWKQYLQLYPNSPLKAQVQKRIKQDNKAASSATIGTGSAGSSGQTKSPGKK